MVSNTMTLGSASWTQSIPSCGSIIYTLFDTSTSAVADPIFSMWRSGGSIVVATSNPTKIKIWNL
jgi:hypothetical protein